MYKKIAYIIITALAALAVSCGGSGGGSGSDGTGTLIINISNISSKLILPEGELSAESYIVTGKGPAGATFTRTITNESSAEIQRLVFGEWNIHVEALNINNVSVGDGEASAAIRTGESTLCSIEVTPFSGMGTLDLIINWDTVLTNPHLEITLSRKGYDPFEAPYVLNSIVGNSEVNTELEAGYYTMEINLYDDTGEGMVPLYGGAVETVRIAQGMVTSSTITIVKGASDDDGTGIGGIDNPGFPSPGAPVGSDAVSASTNQSGKEQQTSPKLSPLAGAAFVQAPQIGNYGSVGLNYAVDVPAGRAGMQPSVGLSYSSSGGDGLLGIGWSMGTGLGVITRTTRYGELYYDYRDVFTYNGKRLVKVSGPDYSEEGIYRQEIESGFSRFELTGTGSGGVWHVYDKSGTITVFGEDRASRVYKPDNENKTYIWNFSRSYDLNGNYMQAVYDTSKYSGNNILYLKEIKYTGNYEKNAAPKQFVRFNYKDREDAYVSKSAGFIMKMDRLLDTIVVGWMDARTGSWGGTEKELWRYEMVYETSADSVRPLLQTVNSTKNTTKPVFRYQDAEHYFVWNLVNNPNYSRYADPSKVKYFEGDFNGDGISDMVFFDPSTGYWKAAEGQKGGGYSFPTYGNRYNGYDSELKIQFFKGNVTGDYNGDGRSDIAFYLPETKEFIVAEHNGTNFNFKSYGKLAISNFDIMKCEWFTGDYDGNGLSDAVLFDEITGDWWLMRNLGGKFSFIKFSKHFKNLFRDDYDPDMNMDSNYTEDNSDYGKHRGKVYFLSGDYNGDGRTDISLYDSRDGKWWVAENYRTSSANGVSFTLQWKLYKVFTAPEQALFGNDRFSGDFNGDGFSDFMLFDRAKGQWIIGETGDGTINFRIFSQAPQFKDITRWLQGDFNGDGRTDIGFYSKTDNNFWIGEATPDGFRYRIYNNLSNGPDPATVLKTPLPKDEVDIKTGKAVVSGGSSTTFLEYKYDGNIYEGKGEKIFTGNFTGVPGTLIYRKNASGDLARGWHYAGSGSSGRAINLAVPNYTFNPEAANITVLNKGKAYRYRNGTDARDGVLYFDSTSHSFGIISNSGAVGNTGSGNWANDVLGTYTGFDIDNGMYMIGDFGNSGIDADSMLVLNAGGSEPFFYLNSQDIDIQYDGSFFSLAPPDFRSIFTDYASAKSGVHIFTGSFTLNSGTYHVLMADARQSAHKWYAGKVESDRVSFEELSGENFIAAGYSGIYRFTNDSIIYSTLNGSRVQFHQISINTTYNEIRMDSFNPLNESIKFSSDFDYKGNPVVLDGTAYKYFNIATGALVAVEPGTTSGYVKAELARNDLMDNYYPFQWIQGDYNGDGKTDIGIFNLAEPRWYFANTTGTVPDLLNEAWNGIGGIYRMTYINSTTVDNRGDDGLPHLPMNYKVCDSLTVDDGRGNTVTTKYSYKKGYAYSAFINGYKETDYFGFGEFTVTDAFGSKTISTYNNVPYSDFRMNRALAGAIKNSRFAGNNGVEYSRTEYDYKLHEISPPNPPEGSLIGTSFLIEPIEVRSFKDNAAGGASVLTQTKRSNIVLRPREYEMVSKTESVTDHYTDSAHAAVTVSSYTEYENIYNTNEMRVILKRNFMDSPNETTSDYYYDSRGNLQRQTLRYTGSGLAGVSNRDTVYEYDSYGNKTKETDRSGSPYRITERSYEDAAGLYQYVTEVRSWTGAIYLTNKNTVNYESAFGGIAASTDPNGNSTYYDYDQYGRLFRQRADSDFGDKRVLNEYLYDASFPLSAKVIQYTGTTDPQIETRVYADGMGRTIHSVHSAGPNPTNKKYTKTGLLVYDAAGRLIRKSQTDWAIDDEINIFRSNSKEKYPTNYFYDPAGRQSLVVLPKAYSGEAETSIAYTYNDPWETMSEHSAGRKKRTVTNGRGLVLYVEDSGLGDDNAETSAAIGFAYDAAGNRIKKMDLTSPLPPNPPEVGFNAGMNVTIDNSLFSAGVKDTSGSNICQWRYDGFGRLVESSDPDLGYTAVEYNAFGDVVERTDGLNRATAFAYDSLGRIISKTLPGSEGTVLYTYDQISGSENALGRMVEMNDPAQRKIFSYDRMGRIDKETREIKSPPNPPEGGLSGGIFETSFEYDLMNRKRSIVYPRDPRTGGSITAKYSYSAAGVTGVDVLNHAGRKEIISSILYNEFGQMTDVERGNKTSTHYTYDIKGRLSSLITHTESNAQTRKLQDVSYKFKTDNSIASVTNTPDIDTDGGYLSQVKYDYKYDGLNRLVKANGQYAKSAVPNGTTLNTLKSFEHGFEYSANGNMLSKSMMTNESAYDKLNYAYAGGNHAVTIITSAVTSEEKYAMQYDGVGNMTGQTGPPNPPEGGLSPASKTMEYDSYNRIIRVSNPDVGNEAVGTYWYDDQGFRVRKLAKRRVAGEDRQVEVLYPSMYFGLERQRHADGSVIDNSNYSVNNIYLDGVRIAAVIPSGDARYYLTDQVDSVKVVADDNGQAVSRMEYMPYGETWFEEGDTNNAPKYNSQELDRESNLYYYNARHYDAGVARFVTADSIVPRDLDTQSWNRYSYCVNNPIIYKDPTGHEDQKIYEEKIGEYTVEVNAGVQSGDVGVIKKEDTITLVTGKESIIALNITTKKGNKIVDNYCLNMKENAKLPLDKLAKETVEGVKEYGGNETVSFKVNRSLKRLQKADFPSVVTPSKWDEDVRSGKEQIFPQITGPEKITKKDKKDLSEGDFYTIEGYLKDKKQEEQKEACRKTKDCAEEIKLAPTFIPIETKTKEK